MRSLEKRKGSRWKKGRVGVFQFHLVKFINDFIPCTFNFRVG